MARGLLAAHCFAGKVRGHQRKPLGVREAESDLVAAWREDAERLTRGRKVSEQLLAFVHHAGRAHGSSPLTDALRQSAASFVQCYRITPG